MVHAIRRRNGPGRSIAQLRRHSRIVVVLGTISAVGTLTPGGHLSNGPSAARLSSEDAVHPPVNASCVAAVTPSSCLARLTKKEDRAELKARLADALGPHGSLTGLEELLKEHQWLSFGHLPVPSRRTPLAEALHNKAWGQIRIILACSPKLSAKESRLYLHKLAAPPDKPLKPSCSSVTEEEMRYIVGRLAEMARDVNHKDANGCTPLDIAIRADHAGYGYARTLRSVLQELGATVGASPETQNHRGGTSRRETAPPPICPPDSETPPPHHKRRGQSRQGNDAPTGRVDQATDVVQRSKETLRDPVPETPSSSSTRVPSHRGVRDPPPPPIERDAKRKRVSDVVPEVEEDLSPIGTPPRRPTSPRRQQKAKRLIVLDMVSVGRPVSAGEARLDHPPWRGNPSASVSPEASLHSDGRAYVDALRAAVASSSCQHDHQTPSEATKCERTFCEKFIFWTLFAQVSFHPRREPRPWYERIVPDRLLLRLSCARRRRLPKLLHSLVVDQPGTLGMSFREKDNRLARFLGRYPQLLNMPYEGRLPLHDAIRKGHWKEVVMLLYYGADPGKKSEAQGRNALHWLALQADQTDSPGSPLFEYLAALMMMRGADAFQNDTTPEKWTPFGIITEARNSKREQWVRLLHDYPWYKAAGERRQEVVKTRPSS